MTQVVANTDLDRIQEIDRTLQSDLLWKGNLYIYALIKEAGGKIHIGPFFSFFLVNICGFSVCSSVRLFATYTLYKCLCLCERKDRL